MDNLQSLSAMARISARMSSLYAMAVVAWYLAMASTKVLIFQNNAGSTMCTKKLRQ